MPINSPDVVIIGAGIAGCATALALKRFAGELSVCIIDRGRRETHDDTHLYEKRIRPKVGETLPPQVNIPLQQLGVWDAFVAADFLRSGGTASCWGSDAPHSNEYIFSPYGTGWHIDRRRFDDLLRNSATGQDIGFFDNARFLTFHRTADRWRIKFSTQSTDAPLNHDLTASFIVDATGRTARVAQQLGANKQVLDRLIGIYRFYERDDGNRPGGNTTLIESSEHGWWYSANLPQNQRVVALMTDVDIANDQNYRSVSGFDNALAATQQIHPCLQGLTPLTTPMVSAAHTQRLEKLAGNRWLAVGDSAYTFDPLSSLGIFKALRMSIYAAYAVKDLFNGKDRDLIKYQAVANAEFNQYLSKRREYYAAESRFSDQPFWRRRVISI